MYFTKSTPVRFAHLDTTLPGGLNQPVKVGLAPRAFRGYVGCLQQAIAQPRGCWQRARESIVHILIWLPTSFGSENLAQLFLGSML